MAEDGPALDRDGEGEGAKAPRVVVAGAVETLLARRLGRLLATLGALLLFGVAGAFTGIPSGRTIALVVAVAAPLAAASALAYGLRTLRQAHRRPTHPWTAPLAAGGVPVWGYGLLVLTLGLRGLALAGGGATASLGRALAAALLALLGAAVLRAWWRVGEVDAMVALLGQLPGDE